MKSDNQKTALLFYQTEVLNTKFRSSHSRFKNEGVKVSAVVANDFIRWWMQLWFPDVEFFTAEEYLGSPSDSMNFDYLVG